jgi:hypothetical protein
MTNSAITTQKENDMTVIEMSSSTDVREATIPLQHLGLFNQRLAALAAKAQEFGIEPMTAVEVERFNQTFVSDTGVRYPVAFVTLRISGITPRLPGGWTFLGSIEHAVNGLTLVHGDDERLLALRDLPSYCEHCQTQRLRRKTIVVESAAGEMVRLGSSCVKDYLGLHGDPARYLDFVDDFLGDEIEELGKASRVGDRAITLAGYLSLVSATMRYFGAFVPKTGDSPTATWIDYMLGRLVPMESERRIITGINLGMGADDDERAAAAIEWAQGIDANVDNSYLSNLHQISLEAVLLPQHYGLAASMIAAYEREMVKVALRAAEAAEVAGVVVEGRCVIEGTVLSTKLVESGYGESLKMLVRVEQADGVVRLWGSVPSSIDPEIGDTVRFTATVETGRDADFGFFKRPTKAEVVA